MLAIFFEKHPYCNNEFFHVLKKRPPFSQILSMFFLGTFVLPSQQSSSSFVLVVLSHVLVRERQVELQFFYGLYHYQKSKLVQEKQKTNSSSRFFS